MLTVTVTPKNINAQYIFQIIQFQEVSFH